MIGDLRDTRNYDESMAADEATRALPDGPWTVDLRPVAGIPSADVLDATGSIIADCQQPITVDGTTVWPTARNHRLARAVAALWQIRDHVYAALESLEPIDSDLIARSRVADAITQLNEARRLLEGER
jgi:hypothetical protein